MRPEQTKELKESFVINDRVTFIVASIINLSDAPLSYVAKRSIFSAKERIEQTKRTIASIRQRVPGARVLLVEQGSKDDLPSELTGMADEYRFIGGRRAVRLACDSPFKGLGEVVALLQLRKDLQPDRQYFKISGRYHLDDHFDIGKWRDTGFGFKYRSPSSVCTVVYKVSGDVLGWWFLSLWLSIPFCLLNRPIESIFHRFIPNSKIHRTDIIGVSGLASVNAEEFSD
jgi:hypothetical protein